MDAGTGEWWVEVRSKNACRACPEFSGMFLKSILWVAGTSLSVGFIFQLLGIFVFPNKQSFDHFPSFSTLNICNNWWQLRRRISHNTSLTLPWTKSPFTTWKQGDFDSSLDIKRVFTWSCLMEIVDSWFILANQEEMPYFYFSMCLIDSIFWMTWCHLPSHLTWSHISAFAGRRNSRLSRKNPESLGFCLDDACTIASCIKLFATMALP